MLPGQEAIRATTSVSTLVHFRLLTNLRGLRGTGARIGEEREIEFFLDNLLVRIHFIILMIRWTGLAPWEFEFPFPGSLTSTFLHRCPHRRRVSWSPSLPGLPYPLSEKPFLTGFLSKEIWGGHTRQEEVEVSPTQSRISSSIQRILRKCSTVTSMIKLCSKFG